MLNDSCSTTDDLYDRIGQLFDVHITCINMHGATQHFNAALRCRMAHVRQQTVQSANLDKHDRGMQLDHATFRPFQCSIFRDTRAQSPTTL
jgi:hypothetical protein